MRRQKGFTLIELLIVVAIIGIIAAIAIPNLLNAINRGRQKRTMADIRSIGTACEAYQVDFNYYPKVAGAGDIQVALNPYITPTYIKIIPANDGWSRKIGWDGSATAGTSYTIYSTGKYGTGTVAAGAATTDFAMAIVFADGRFVQWPDGLQTN